MIIFIVSTELVIRWNRIEGVSVVRSTGQILPIVAATSSFIDVMWQFVIKVMKGDFGEVFLPLPRHVAVRILIA